jgi:L-lysine 2,3-aminomutase
MAATLHPELARRFRTRISPFVKRHAATMEPVDAEAFLKQFTPDELELATVEGFNDDPLREEDSDIHPFADVVHKYRSKILYLTTDECPVYCRYCTRKRKTLLSAGHADSSPPEIAAYLEGHPEVNEVIFSGGDPLMLPVEDFASRADIFLSVATVSFLRIHTRAVTTAPGLISEKFLQALSQLRQKHPTKGIAFVLHINTAAELSAEACSKIAALRALAIPIYSQSVLLKGINDDAVTLATLCQALIHAGVQPYYLHQLDRVTGSAHFEVDDDIAHSIYKELRLKVPPYMLPKFVRDSKQGKYPM